MVLKLLCVTFCSQRYYGWFLGDEWQWYLFSKTAFVGLL